MGTITFNMDAGLLIRRQVRGYLQRAKFKLEGKVNIDFIEDKGFLASLFTIRISGENEKVQSVYNQMHKQLHDAFGDKKEDTNA